MIDDALRELWRNVMSDPLALTNVQRDMIDFQIMHDKGDQLTVEDIKRLGEWS